MAVCLEAGPTLIRVETLRTLLYGLAVLSTIPAAGIGLALILMYVVMPIGPLVGTALYLAFFGGLALWCVNLAVAMIGGRE